jgi:sec-independent protein translocase protein TatA
VLLFGAKRLPEMARSVGQSARVFKGEMKGLRDDEGRAAPPPPTRSAELPPAAGQSTRQDAGPVTGSGSGVGPGDPQPTEPVRRDADR